MDHPCGLRRALPYLALLRAGFCLPLLLPGARCALTAPFHPYPLRGGMFSVPLVRRVAPPGCYPAHCPGGVRTFLSRRRSPAPAKPCDFVGTRPDTGSGRLAHCNLVSVHRSRAMPGAGVPCHATRRTTVPLDSIECRGPRRARQRPSVSSLIWYCSSFLYRLLRGVSITSAVFEMFQPFSRSLATR
jgi:hypothetical protein